ncbi:hypothetical protein GCM10023080_088570 [Streptomyces pseudoechinosporeus]
MNKHFRKAAMATVLAVGTALGGFAATGAAHADEEVGVIDGSGNTGDDWDDEGTLKKGAESNAVVLWQTVLVADGVSWKDGAGVLHLFTEDDISGEFDLRTASATKFWQKDRGLNQSGKATAASFKAAGNNLGPNKNGTVVYEGSADDVTFKRKTVDGFDKKVYSVNFDGSSVPATY